MTATLSIDVPRWMDAQLSQASPELLRSMIRTFAEALMSADADAVCGAGYGQRSLDRTKTRNGYRHRAWDTRAGSMELAVPKLREGSYFQDWLLEGRRRAESALVSVVATSYLLRVSTRRMERLVEQLGTDGAGTSVRPVGHNPRCRFRRPRSFRREGARMSFVPAPKSWYRPAGRQTSLCCSSRRFANGDLRLPESSPGGRPARCRRGGRCLLAISIAQACRSRLGGRSGACCPSAAEGQGAASARADAMAATFMRTISMARS